MDLYSILLFFQLSRMRFASVTEFRGKKMVNIREYYEADGELKPGRKGILLDIYFNYINLY